MRLPASFSVYLAWFQRPAPRAWLSGACLLLLSASGVWLYAGYVDPVYAIRDWLAWDLLKLWGYLALASLSWLACGNALLRGLGLRDLPLVEHAVVSAALGVVIFTELLYVLGAAHLFRPEVALLLPLGLIALGTRPLVSLVRRYREARRNAPPASAFAALAWAVGGALTLVIYLGVFSPESVNYDASWCHLTIAQDYAREGRIVAFPGDYSKNVPHLASVLHTWGYLVPGLTQPALRWMLALHQEFVVFLWTLAGVAAATRCMLGDERLRGTWVAFYLFPIIFVYDNGLGAAADHFAAFFALPGLLATRRLMERPSWQRALVAAAIMAGGMLTKYQCFYWILPLAVLTAFQLARLAFKALRSRDRQELRRLGVVAATALIALPVLAAPHFLKNWIFYRNPVYPLAQQLFPGSRPTVDNAVFLFNNVFTDLNWVPVGTPVEKAWHAFKLAFTFSFEPHYSFTKNFPAFGSLFTLLLPALLVIRRRGPKLLFAFVGFTTLFLWGYTFNVDRNLQIFMPILVATTAAILIEIWRLGWPSRLAVAPLVGFQLLWGGDALFYSSQDRIRPALDLISTGYNGSATRRYERYRSTFVALGKALPPDATVMLHTAHVTLGVDRRVVLDWSGFQGLIGYSRIHNSRELHEMYRRVGMTHLMYVPGERPASSIQEEVLFQSYVASLAAPLATTGGFRLHRLPDAPPPAEPSYRVLVLGLRGYGSGVFPIERLSTNEYIDAKKRSYARAKVHAPNTEEALEALNVDAVVVGANTSLGSAQSEFLRRHFSSVVSYPGQQTIYLRKSRARAG
jgi:hypothetical protein